jgi:hypothetical protein
MSRIIDLSAPSLQGGIDRRPEELPHGFISPPPEVLEMLEREKAQRAPDVFENSKERLLNEWTIDYYFENLSHDVIYRPTPKGPDVLAVGYQEVVALKKTMPLEEQLKLKTFLDYNDVSTRNGTVYGTMVIEKI